MVNVAGLGGLFGTQPQQKIEKSNAKLQAAIAQLVSGTRRAQDDVASLSIATQLQTEVVGLKKVSGNIAQASSLAQVADSGAEQIQTILYKLKDLALQAKSPSVSDDIRKTLNDQFQSLKSAVDRFADNTSFNSKKLLDGSLSGPNKISFGGLLDSSVEGDEGLEIKSLSASSLFESKSPDISTPANIDEALKSIDTAIGKVTETRVSIGTFEQTLDYAAANIDSAVANQEAARSVLSDADFLEAVTESNAATLQRNAAIALAAQGNRLSPQLLKLVS